jgi:hypothetical protein
MCDYLSLPLEKKIDRVNLLRRAGETDKGKNFAFVLY